MTCLPVTTNSIPLLPVTNTQAGPSQHGSLNIALNPTGQPANVANQPTHGNAPLLGTKGHPSAHLPPPGSSKDMYWCVEKVYTEPTESHLFPILHSHTLGDDEELYRHVNRAIKGSVGSSIKGWILQRLSWKRCTQAEFVKVLNPRQSSLQQPDRH